ncbi:MAG TPA: hypothetical protein VM032_16855 [Vicinamibacterales bacterium]|nr:hypothetical protein [Vicinamibacterales bacterium]
MAKRLDPREIWRKRRPSEIAAERDFRSNWILADDGPDGPIYQSYTAAMALVSYWKDRALRAERKLDPSYRRRKG